MSHVWPGSEVPSLGQGGDAIAHCQCAPHALVRAPFCRPHKRHCGLSYQASLGTDTMQAQYPSNGEARHRYNR